MWSTWLQLFVFAVSLLQRIINVSSNDESDVISHLFVKDKYDPHVRPDANTSNPVHVACSLRVIEVTSLSAINMDFTIHVLFRQIWRDPRLQYNLTGYGPTMAMALGKSRVDDIWVPDTYFRNEKRASRHDITTMNLLLHLYPNGTIYQSQRLTITISCPMNFTNFPFDKQVCLFEAESFGHTTRHLKLDWFHTEPVKNKQTFDLAEFHRPCIQHTAYEDTYFSGNYSVLEARFEFVRDSGYYIVQTYLPNILNVILSWISFWLDVDATPARISLGILTVLTMTTQSEGMRNMLPKVSYIKAIDVWMSTCLFFVFAAFLEFALVNVMARRERRLNTQGNKKSNGETKEISKISNNKIYSENSEDAGGHPDTNNSAHIKRRQRIVIRAPTLRWPARSQTYNLENGSLPTGNLPYPLEYSNDLNNTEYRSTTQNRTLRRRKKWKTYLSTRFLFWDSRKVEKVSRVAFPLLFAIFNIVYWVYYVGSREDCQRN